MKIKKTIRKWLMLSSVILFPTSVILVIAQLFSPVINEKYLVFLGPAINPYVLLGISTLMLAYTCWELKKKRKRMSTNS